MMLFKMKRYLLVILMLIYGNSYANSDYSADDYSYQDILKYREMINKIPEDKFLKNTVPTNNTIVIMCIVFINSYIFIP